MADTSDRGNLFGAVKGAYTAGAIVTAYFLQPVIGFADPRWLAAGGVTFAVGVGSLYADSVTGAGWRTRIASNAVMLVGFATLMITGLQAIYASGRNDDRCVVIQQAMLHPDARTRKDLPEIYQALRCRPR